VTITFDNPSARDVELSLLSSESVAILDWPEQADQAAALAAWGAPRLLLVAPGAEPPVDWDVSSDWLRRPADARDVMMRIETLQRRSSTGQGPVRLDPDGLLWRGRKWVALPPIEVRLVELFLEHAHRVVRRSELMQAAWPNETRAARTLDVRLQRLRTRLKPLGLEIASVRQRGFVFTFEDTGRATGD
jgi:hypothetical protein